MLKNVSHKNLYYNPLSQSSHIMITNAFYNGACILYVVYKEIIKSNTQNRKQIAKEMDFSANTEERRLLHAQVSDSNSGIMYLLVVLDTQRMKNWLLTLRSVYRYVMCILGG